MIAALPLLVATATAGGVELPPRPTQEPVAANACPEADVDGGVVFLPDGCSGIVLPVEVWAHLEALAVDSRQVRQLWQVREAQYAYDLALCQGTADACQQQIDALSQPQPFFQREGVRSAGYMLGGAAAILLGGVALQLIDEEG